ncbi:Uncharacterised protein [Clostridioides difficile]|nr:Uncharacterised protein [Clostridioides difficile]
MSKIADIASFVPAEFVSVEPLAAPVFVTTPSAEDVPAIIASAEAPVKSFNATSLLVVILSP